MSLNYFFNAQNFYQMEDKPTTATATTAPKPTGGILDRLLGKVEVETVSEVRLSTVSVFKAVLVGATTFFVVYAIYKMATRPTPKKQG